VYSSSGFFSLALVTSLWFWIAVSVYLAVHLAIDRAKQEVVVRKKLVDSASVFLVDQGVHVWTIVALAWFLIRPDWATLSSQLSWSTTTGDKVPSVPLLQARRL